MSGPEILDLDDSVCFLGVLIFPQHGAMIMIQLTVCCPTVYTLHIQ